MRSVASWISIENRNLANLLGPHYVKNFQPGLKSQTEDGLEFRHDYMRIFSLS